MIDPMGLQADPAEWAKRVARYNTVGWAGLTDYNQGELLKEAISGQISYEQLAGITGYAKWAIDAAKVLEEAEYAEAYAKAEQQAWTSVFGGMTPGQRLMTYIRNANDPTFTDWWQRDVEVQKHSQDFQQKQALFLGIAGTWWVPVGPPGAGGGGAAGARFALVSRLRHAIGSEAASFIGRFGRLTSGATHGEIVSAARTLGWKGEVVVLKGFNPRVGAGVTEAGELVVWEQAFLKGFTREQGSTLQGSALIAHEVGHAFAPVQAASRLLPRTQMWIKEAQASGIGATLKGLGPAERKMLIEDMRKMTEMFRKAGGKWPGE
jgi:hypothetical protein